MPILSVIIPVYNKALYLKDTVTAFEKQTFRDFELILVDDGSTDGSTEIADNLAEQNKKIHVIHQKNEGVSSARNRGIEAAKGEWLWFVDADDIPNVEFAIEAMRQSELFQFDVFCGNYDKISESDTIPVRNPHDGLLSSTNLVDSFVKFQPETGYYGFLWNKIMRRELVFAHSIRFQRGLTLAEDLDFMVSVYQYAKSVFISPCIAMKYRVDAMNASREKKIDYEAQLRIQIHIQDWFRSVNKDVQYRTFLNTNITKYATFVLFYANEDGQPVKKVAHELLSIPAINSSLVEWGDPGVMGRIAHYLRLHQLTRLQLYLTCRTLLRKLYRLSR